VSDNSRWNRLLTSPQIKPGFDLAALLRGGRLGMADTDSVPPGKYGKAALEKLGVWNSVQPFVAPAESVRAAPLFVSRREAPLGIVYATDAAADPALTADSKNPSGARLLDLLGSPAAKPIFEKEGFSVLARGGSA
jgi:molybdate transport system substrate-binding protein